MPTDEPQRSRNELGERMEPNLEPKGQGNRAVENAPVLQREDNGRVDQTRDHRVETANRKAEPKPEAKKQEMVQVLLLKGYVPQDGEVVSYGPMVVRQTGPGELEYKDMPATLAKHKRGEVVDLPADEARKLIRAGVAVRPDEATDNQLIAAGLKKPPRPEADDA